MRASAIDKRPAGSNVTFQVGAVVAHNLKLCPIATDILAMIPAERRVGPPIIDERAGRMPMHARGV
jgi:hypothetical protein